VIPASESRDFRVGTFDAPRNDGENPETPMMTLAFVLLLVGALAGGFVSGLAGFGTALMALGIWLYVLPPSIAVSLVLICSIVAQTSTLPSFWRSIDFKLVWPFVIGGLAGLSGALPTLWASVRGWGKDERRGVFQTFNWIVLSAALCLQAGTGLITGQVVRLALLALPATLFGAWLGARTYRMLSDRNFHDVVLGLLFLSGVGLVWSNLALR
jgi:uncharacterized membrane protein YfcA